MFRSRFHFSFPERHLPFLNPTSVFGSWVDQGHCPPWSLEDCPSWSEHKNVTCSFFFFIFFSFFLPLPTFHFLHRRLLVSCLIDNVSGDPTKPIFLPLFPFDLHSLFSFFFFFHFLFFFSFLFLLFLLLVIDFLPFRSGNGQKEEGRLDLTPSTQGFLC